MGLSIIVPPLVGARTHQYPRQIFQGSTWKHRLQTKTRARTPGGAERRLSLADLESPSVRTGYCCARDYGDSETVSSEREDSFGTGAEAARRLLMA